MNTEIQSARSEEDGVKSLLLSERHTNLGAIFGHEDGWRVVQSYGTPSDEYLTVRNDVGIIDLSNCGLLSVSGGESERFLNGLVTNDVKTLSKGSGMRAAFLTGHGKVRALCRIIGLGDSYLIINEPETHEKIHKYVFPFSYAGDFKVEDVTAQYGILSVQGPKALLVMKEVCFEPVPSMDEHQWLTAVIAGHDATVVRSTHSPDGGYDLLVPKQGVGDVWDFILLKGGFHGIKPFGQEALDILRVEAGIPVYGVDVDESNMMLETGLSDAVSFTKGCYTGQEAVAMATYRGHVSKKLSGLLVDGDLVPARGDRVLVGERNVGSVTSAIRSEALGRVIAMAYIKYGFFNPGTAVDVQTEAGPLRASVSEMPFKSKS